jgi:hypothetical protein
LTRSCALVWSVTRSGRAAGLAAAHQLGQDLGGVAEQPIEMAFLPSAV